MPCDYQGIEYAAGQKPSDRQLKTADYFILRILRAIPTIGL